MHKLSQRGAIHLALLVAAIGLIGFFVVSQSADFKNKLFNALYPNKQSSFASAPISGPVTTPIIVSCVPSKAALAKGESVTYTMNVDPGSYSGKLSYGWNGDGNTRASGFNWTSANNQTTFSGSYETDGNKIMVASVWYSN